MFGQQRVMSFGGWVRLHLPRQASKPGDLCCFMVPILLGAHGRLGTGLRGNGGNRELLGRLILPINTVSLNLKQNALYYIHIVQARPPNILCFGMHSKVARSPLPNRRWFCQTICLGTKRTCFKTLELINSDFSNPMSR